MSRTASPGQVELLSSRAAALGIEVPDARVPPDHTSAGALAEVCVAELDRAAGTRGRRLGELSAELLRLSDSLSEAETLNVVRRLEGCERALSRLRGVGDTDGLLDRVCDELVESVGFRRVMLARVEMDTWRPWKANRALLGEEWVSRWIETRIPLDEMTVETRLLRERRPTLVEDTDSPSVVAMVREAQVTSYVVAPVVSGERVIGFLHADHGPSGVRCEEIDRDLLGVFANGFAQIFECLTLRERLLSRRDRAAGALLGAERAIDALSEPELRLTRTGHEDEPTPRAAGSARGRIAELTPRELEVLQLIVAGARNGEIAERLLITTGTVKAHVKHILAKLGVINRTQAVALYYGREP